MTKILFLTLVHPDFLPPVYAMSGVLQNNGYEIDIFTFESSISGNQEPSFDSKINIIAKHSGSYIERAKSRYLFQTKVTDYVKDNQPKAIFAYCEFTYLTALKFYGKIPVFYFALELTNNSIKNLFKSPLNELRTRKANFNLEKASFLATPSYERSSWLAGRYKLKIIPETVMNSPYISKNFNFSINTSSTLIPPSFEDKVLILNTGGVNNTRAIIELVVGFEKTNSDTRLIITNVTNSSYSEALKEVVNKSTRKEDILLLGPVSRNELLELQESCQIGICLMKLENGFDARMIAPNKVGEYFKSGALVLGVDTPYFYQFVPYDIVELVTDLKPETISMALDKLVIKVISKDYKDKILKCLKQWYNMERQMTSVLTLIKKF